MSFNFSFAVVLALSSVASTTYASSYTESQNNRDTISSAILINPIERIDQGRLDGEVANYAIHRNFPRIIDQNLAQMSQAGMRKFFDGLSSRELRDLSQLYTTAAHDTGYSGQLLPLLVSRLDGARLGRLSQYFGYAAVYQATALGAPEKLTTFEQNTNRSYSEPLAGVLRDAIEQTPHNKAGNGKWLNFTPKEIYLDMRTAPVGALGVTGALYETVNVLAVEGGIAFGLGWTAGTAAVNLIQTYNPPLWDAISAKFDAVFKAIDNATSQYQLGNAEKSSGTLFGLLPGVSRSEYTTGGDFGNSSAWESNYNTCKLAPLGLNDTCDGK